MTAAVERKVQLSTAIAASQPVRIRHLPALDGLRGLAVLGVVLYHGGYLLGGYLGVDLFFVLSGFLITALLLEEHGDRGRISLRSFWSRRARRLLPALYLFLLGILGYALLWAQPVDLGPLRSDVHAALLYVSNWSTIRRELDYWTISLAPSPLQHLWSLAVEEQAYLVWPLVVVAVTRRRSPSRAPVRVLVAALVGAALSLVAALVLGLADASTTRRYEGTDVRAFGLLCGAALAAWWQIDRRRAQPSTMGRSVLAALGPLAALLLAAAWFLVDGRHGLLYLGGLQLCSLLATVVIGASILPGGIPGVRRLLVATPLRLLGLVSYGVYLWHWPVFLVLNEVRTGRQGVVLLGLRLVVSLWLALGSYLLVERPARAGAWPGRAAVLAVPACAAALGLATVAATSGAMSANDAAVVEPARQAAIHVPGAPRVLFVGDSVAGSVADYPVADPVTYGLEPYNGAVIGCGLVYEGNRVRGGAGDISEPPACSPGWASLVEEQHPDATVVLFGAPPVSAIEIDGVFRTACEPEYLRLLRERLEAEVTVLGADGGVVALVTNAPTTNPFRLPESDRSTACANEVVRAVADDGPAELVDLARFLCPDGRCRDTLDGAPVRPDSLHFHGAGGAVVARWIVDRVLALLG